MIVDPVDALESILKRNGRIVDLRGNEVDRYFLFDQIPKADELDLAWSLFPAHQEVRARSVHVDAVSNIISGWGYRTPKKTNRCSDAELADLVRKHLAAIHPLIPNDCRDVRAFLENGFDAQVVGNGAGTPPDPMKNVLFGTLCETICEFMIERLSFDDPLIEILHDWAIYLTKCDEVALYLLWPILKGVGGIDADTPVPGFELWKCHCRTNYWIKDGDFRSGVVCIQPPWSVSKRRRFW